MQEFPAVIPTFLGILSLSLLPFIVVMATSFTKISIVLMLLRNALGVQQAPSGLVINSIALTLTIFIMVPVGDNILQQLQVARSDLGNWENTFDVFKIVADGLADHLRKFTTDREIAFFMDVAKKIWPENMHLHIRQDNIFLLLPAHVASELTRAFEIAFLLFLPFLAIDMIVSNILLAMGAMMVPPMLISLPIKLLLFIAADGWTRLLHGLVLSYV